MRGRLDSIDWAILKELQADGNITNFGTLNAGNGGDTFNVNANTTASLNGGTGADSFVFADAAVLTIEFKVNLMSPGKGDRFLFRGEITKPGSNIIVADGRAYAIGDGPAKLIASMTGTKMALRGREDIRG